jgi:hypothetical protein
VDITGSYLDEIDILMAMKYQKETTNILLCSQIELDVTLWENTCLKLHTTLHNKKIEGSMAMSTVIAL